MTAGSSQGKGKCPCPKAGSLNTSTPRLWGGYKSSKPTTFRNHRVLHCRGLQYRPGPDCSGDLKHRRREQKEQRHCWTHTRRQTAPVELSVYVWGVLIWWLVAFLLGTVRGVCAACALCGRWRSWCAALPRQHLLSSLHVQSEFVSVFDWSSKPWQHRSINKWRKRKRNALRTRAANKQTNKNFCKGAAGCQCRVGFFPNNVMQRCASRWQRLLREALPYWGWRSITTCCGWPPWEAWGGRRSCARSQWGEREGGDKPLCGCGSIGVSWGTSLWASMLPQAEPRLSQHECSWAKGSQNTAAQVPFPNGVTSLSRATGFCTANSGSYMLARLFCSPVLHPVPICRGRQGQGSQPTHKSCMGSPTQHLLPSPVWKTLRDQQLTLLNSSWLIFAAQAPVKKPRVGPGFPAGFQHSQLSFLAGNVHLGTQPSASAVIPVAFLPCWGWG